jgi:PAS domain S-box-containing protein
MRSKFERILILGDSLRNAQNVYDRLNDAGVRLVDVRLAAGLDDGLVLLGVGVFACVVLCFPDAAAPDVVRRVCAQVSDLPVIVVGQADTDDQAAAVIQAGAQDYVPAEPLDPRILSHALRRVIQRQTADQKRRAGLSFQSEESVRYLLSKSMDGVLIVDRQGVIRFFNRAAETMTGRSYDELAGSSFGFPMVVGEAAELNLVRRDGRRTVAEMRVVEIEWNGEMAYLATLRDITRRKKAEEAMRRECERAQQYLDIAGVILVALDTRGQIVLINRQGCCILGYAESELVGQNWFDVCLPPDMRGAARDVFQVLLVGELALVEYFENQVVTKSGERRIIAWYNRALLNAGGEITGVLSSGQDVTEERQAQQDLCERDALYRKMFEGHLAIMLLIDPRSGGIFDANPAACEFYGYDHETLCSMCIAEINCSSPEQVNREMASALALERNYFNFSHRLASGEIREVEVRSLPIEVQGQKLLYSIIHDVTERRRAEQSEREQRALAEALREITAALTSTLDLDTVLSLILENVVRVVPHHAANIMLVENDEARIVRQRGYGDPDLDESLEQDRWPVAEVHSLRQMYETAEPVFSYSAHTGTGWLTPADQDWVNAYAGVPICLEERVIGFINLASAEPDAFTAEHADRLQIFADQAALAVENARLYESVQHYALDLEQRVVERTEALRRSTERAEAILNSSSDSIIVAQADGTIEQVNPAFSALFGYAAQEIVGQPLSMLVAPEWIEPLEQALEGASVYREARRIDLVARRSDGTPFDSDLSLAPSTLGGGQWANVVCSLRDISQRKQLEQDLRAALEKEKELNELQTYFGSMVSHEFRTPLATIRAANTLLVRYRDQLPEDKQQAQFERIDRQVIRLVALLDDILAISRMQTLSLDFNPAPLNLMALCEEILDEYAMQANGRVKLMFSHENVPSRVYMDAKLLRNILGNLLGNAIKYSYFDGVVQFTIGCDAECVTLRVVDNGIGIPEADQKRMFEPFHRGENVRGVHGTGLGLSIVKRAVDIYGGTITVQSGVGQGTTVTVVLPYDRVAAL